MSDIQGMGLGAVPAGVGGGLYSEVQCIMGEGHIQTPCEKTKRHE